MNAAEARKSRQGSTLYERVRKDKRMAARIDRLVAEASVEYALQETMKAENPNTTKRPDPSERARKT